MQQLKLTYGTNRNRHYTEDEDRFLLLSLARVGYGNEQVRDAGHSCVVYADPKTMLLGV